MTNANSFNARQPGSENCNAANQKSLGRMALVRRGSRTGRKLDYQACEPRQMMAPLPFGQIVDGQISSAGEIDSLDFYAPAGMVIDLKMISSSSAAQFKATARLLAPNGQQIASFNADSGNFAGGGYGNQRISLPNQSGTYRLNVSDDNVAQAGTYAVGLERISSPSPGGATLPKGGVVPGSISRAVEKDQWTFYGLQGDVIDLKLWSQPSSVFRATASLFQPGGHRIAAFDLDTGNWSFEGGGYGNQRITLGSTGVYILQIADLDYRDTGSYLVGFEGIKSYSPSPLTIPPGSIRTGTISSVLQKDQYVFYANQGERIDLKLRSVATQTGFWAKAELFRPDGHRMATFDQDNGNFEGGGYGNERITMGQTGHYVLQVSDDNYLQKGSYSVGLERLNFGFSPDVENLSRNATVTRSIANVLQKNQFRITVASTGSITLTLSGASSSTLFRPRLEIFNAAGQRIGTFNGPVSNASFFISQPGQYLLMVSDEGFNATGSFGLRWA